MYDVYYYIKKRTLQLGACQFTRPIKAIKCVQKNGMCIGNEVFATAAANAHDACEHSCSETSNRPRTPVVNDNRHISLSPPSHLTVMPWQTLQMLIVYDLGQIKGISIQTFISSSIYAHIYHKWRKVLECRTVQG